MMPRSGQTASPAVVPVFFLFGEPRRSVGPRFLHLEPLEERSRPTDWMIRPHTHADLHHVFLITEGAGHINADGAVIHFTAPSVLTVPAGIVHGFGWQPKTCGQVLTLSDSYLRELLARAPDFTPLFEAVCYERSGWNSKGKLLPPPGAVTNMMGAEVYGSNVTA